MKKIGNVDPHAFGSEGTQKLHAGGDESHRPSRVRALSMVDGDTYLQNTFVEIPYFSLLIPPDLFKRLMTIEIFTPIELPYAFEEL